MIRFNASGKKTPMFHEELFLPNEEQECMAFYDYTQLVPTIAEYTVHFANEGKRTNGARLKRIGGLPKGFPDYCIFVPRGRYHSLFIEMKTQDERGKKQKKEQIMWINRLLKIGHYATFAYGCDDGIRIVKDYLGNKL